VAADRWTKNQALGSNSASTLSQSSPPPIPPWMVNRLALLDLNHGPLARYFENLAQENTPKAKRILVEADQLADTLGEDDTLLDGLLAGLGLE
jgi:hypothetical protein